MVCLALFGYFRLPDDFAGSYSEAIRLLADYHQSARAKSKRTAVNSQGPPMQSQLWAGFDKQCIQGDKKVHMFLGVNKLQDDGQWKMVEDRREDGQGKRADAAGQDVRK